MSLHIHDTAEEAVLQERRMPDAWEQEIVPLLPKGIEEQAWRLGATSRKSGKIHRATDHYEVF